MKRKKRVSRLLETVLLIQAQPDWRPKRLARHFGVSETNVLEPKELRELMKDNAERMVKTYSRKARSRRRAQSKVAEDLEWAGKAPLPVFVFKVQKDFKHYTFIIPKPCGNIALVDVKEIIPDAVCDIQVSPAKANINDPISVDMSGSQHAKSMEVEIFDAEGTKIASQTLTPDSPKWQTKFDKPGEYVFKAKALNVKGVPSTNPCEAKTYINAPPT